MTDFSPCLNLLSIVCPRKYLIIKFVLTVSQAALQSLKILIRVLQIKSADSFEHFWSRRFAYFALPPALPATTSSRSPRQGCSLASSHRSRSPVIAQLVRKKKKETKQSLLTFKTVQQQRSLFSGHLKKLINSWRANQWPAAAAADRGFWKISRLSFGECVAFIGIAADKKSPRCRVRGSN